MLIVLTAAATPAALWAHDGFLPLHEHSEHHHAHGHAGHEGHAHADHTHAGTDGKAHQHLHLDQAAEPRWAIATGLSYTRYASEQARGHLWTIGLGADFELLPWLHFGGDVSYGWFDASAGKANGWLTPHAHLDIHAPLAGNFELIAGLEVGLPLSGEELAGEHWEVVPHVELRYDTPRWYAATGVAFAYTDGAHADHEPQAADNHDEEGAHEHEEGGAEEHDDEHHAHDHPAEEAHLHEIVDPHGERELSYHAAFGVRLLDEKLIAEARFSGVRVISDDTDANNYFRGGLRLTWRVSDSVSISTEGNIPIGYAERNDWQASAALRVRF